MAPRAEARGGRVRTRQEEADHPWPQNSVSLSVRAWGISAPCCQLSLVIRPRHSFIHYSRGWVSYDEACFLCKILWWLQKKKENIVTLQLRLPWGLRRQKHLPTMRETWVQSPDQEDPLEKERATHSSILAWKIPWTEEPCRLQSTGLQRVGHDGATSLYNWGGHSGLGCVSVISATRNKQHRSEILMAVCRGGEWGLKVAVRESFRMCQLKRLPEIHGSRSIMGSVSDPEASVPGSPGLLIQSGGPAHRFHISPSPQGWVPAPKHCLWGKYQTPVEQVMRWLMVQEGVWQRWGIEKAAPPPKKKLPPDRMSLWPNRN